MRSIRTKFLLLFVPAYLVVTLVGLHFVAQQHVQNARAELSSRVGTQLGRVSGLLTPELATTQKAIGSRLMSTLLVDQATKCVDVIFDGQIDRTLSQPRNLGCGVMNPETTVETSILLIPGGKMVLGFSLDEIRAIEIESLEAILIIAFGGLAAASLIATFAFGRTVGRPISRLIKTMQGTGSNQYLRAKAITSDEIGALSGTYNELVDRLESEAAMASAAMEELSNVYNTTPALLFTMDSQGIICSTSTFWSETTGYKEGKCIGQPLWSFILTDACAGTKSLKTALKLGQSVRDVPLRFRTADDEIIDVLLSIVPDRRSLGAAASHVCVMTDVTQLRLTESNLRQLAVTDQLTGLVNRRALADVEVLLGLNDRNDNPLWAVLFIDLDDFKAANDTYGHAAGDQLLVTVAERIKKAAGQTGIAARLGGDEFALVLPSIETLEDATRIAGKLIDDINRPVDVVGGTAYVGASIGIASDRLNNSKPSDSLGLSDQAMYMAKSTGKNRYVVYEGKDATALKERSEFLHALRVGQKDGWFSIHFQPIINLETVKPVALEALLRVTTNEGKTLPTDKFIAVAEETGRMDELGRWIFDEAVSTFLELTDANNQTTMSLSVNLSPRQLNERFVRHVEKTLESKPSLAGRLVLEITEGATMRGFERAKELLERLRDCGARIAVDDFGTGYASLSYISKLPIDILKLDRSFVDQAGGNEARTRSALIRSVSSLTSELDIPLIAEGLEDVGMAEEVLGLGVPLGQGYLFAQPMPADRIAEWLEMFGSKKHTENDQEETAYRNVIV
ncbi:EAL domain-containing protein [Maritalea sp. S77]|uniref:EAL domain-containing protein n=1 Tax=Maritalea sp. S77 TaxID=3415125 RepID=UPI003C7A1D9D